MKTLNASRGLGDALYLRAVVLHLLERKEEVTVFTPWREVFADLPITVKSAKEATGDEDWHHAKPCLHCRMEEMQRLDQFAMCGLQAGITEPVDLRLNWAPKNAELVKSVRRHAMARPILVFQPLKKANNTNEALTRPDAFALRKSLEVRSEYFRVKVGHPTHLDDDRFPCELDLFGKTSVRDALDICAIADLIVSETSFLTVAAQGMNKNFVCIFSGRGRDSGRHRIMNINPDRIFHKKWLGTAVYDDRCAS